jgi:hypothetical protein
MKNKRIFLATLVILVIAFSALRRNIQAAALKQEDAPEDTYLSLVLQAEGTQESYLPVIFRSDPLPTPTPTRVPASPPSYYTTSWYMTPGNIATTTQMGCQAGQQTKNIAGAQDSLIILDFGQPWGNSSSMGTILLKETREGGWRITSTSEIYTAVTAFINGYMTCDDGISSLDVAIGTNNFAFSTGWSNPGCPEDTIRWMCYETNAYNHGVTWAALVRNVAAYVTSNHFDGLITVSGANDIELSWNYPENTIAWVDGFNDNDHNEVIFYNYGACEGCPLGGSTTTNPTLVNGWTLFKAHYTAWRVSPAWPIPEIYLNNGWNAQQWAFLSRWGVDHGYEKMIFLSALTQLKACGGVDTSECPTTDNTPQEAWHQLYNAVNAYPSTALITIPWMTDIDWP